MTIVEFFREVPEAAVAFSGGVDSAALLALAARHARRTKAYFVRTPFQPAFELQDAEDTARRLGAELQVIDYDILAVPAVAGNPPDRCYHCKRSLFTALLAAAKADGFSVVLDGSNASDDAGDRPGMRALRELEVRSPLRECGLTKSDVRRLAREAGLPVWDKPSYACLATRVPTGTAITREDLGGWSGESRPWPQWVSTTSACGSGAMGRCSRSGRTSGRRPGGGWRSSAPCWPRTLPRWSWMPLHGRQENPNRNISTQYCEL